MVMNKLGERNNLSIPDHREVSRDLLWKEIKKAGLTASQFIELLDR